MPQHDRQEKLDSELIEETTWRRTFGLKYEKRSSLLFLVLWYIDYGTERYNLGALLNVIIVGYCMNRSRVIPRSLFERVRDTRDVSAFVGAGPAVVGTSEGALELFAKLSCNKRARIV